MLDAMRQLALDTLWVELDKEGSADPEASYRHLRVKEPARLFPKLVEDVDQGRGSGKDQRHYYTLRADPQDMELAVLEVHEFKLGDAAKLPFNQPSGSQSAALGPLLKRTASNKDKPAGPSRKIQQTTLQTFAEIAGAELPWSAYFRAAGQCFQRPRLQHEGKEVLMEGGALAAAITTIQEKKTVLLAFQDAQGHLPGEVPEFVAYLQEVLAQTKYTTGQGRSCDGHTCALCGAVPTTVYPNALRGAGLNLANLDRDGAFPGLDATAAWKGYALCVACADLLYVYWNHVAKDFLVSVAGYPALLIPATQLDAGLRQEFMKRVAQWRAGVSPESSGKDQVAVRERQLLNLLGNDRAVTTLTFVWAEFGQRMDHIRGVLTDVLPSRLRHLVDVNRAIAQIPSPHFPEWPLADFSYDLSLFILKPLLHRPGGKKAQASNESKRLFDLRRDLAEAIYHQSALPPRFWAEVHRTAQGHWENAASSQVIGLLYEGRSKGGETYLTLAGWIRQLARFLHYLELTGVSKPMQEPLYQPQSAALQPYFSAESGIRGAPRAFAFILGVLYGKLLQVQAARGVNVGANALTWLKRLTLSGRDLPELYVKVREKLLAYETEGNPLVRQLVAELGELGIRLGTTIELDETQTCYFLLLGQSLATKILPVQTRSQPEGETR